MSNRSLKNILSRWYPPSYFSCELDAHKTQHASSECIQVLSTEILRKPMDYDLITLYNRVIPIWQRYRSILSSYSSERSGLDWSTFYEQQTAHQDVLMVRDMRRLPWILFFTPSESQQIGEQIGTNNSLGSDELFLKSYFQWVDERRNARCIRTLMQEFLYSYPIKLSTFQFIRVFLKERIMGVNALQTRSIKKWADRSHKFFLLEDNGDLLFIQSLISTNELMEDIFELSGLVGKFERSSFLESGIRGYLQRMNQMLRSNDYNPIHLQRFLQVLQCEDQLRFDDRFIRKLIAEALLSPFTQEQGPEGAREHIEPFFMTWYGHPFLPSKKPNWNGIDERYRLVIARWQAQKAIDAFFRLIKETALDEHWSYRQRFWQAYFDHNVIQDAYFILGSSARKLLKSMSEDDELSYGMLRGAAAGQSVLLLKMYGATIAEWSHSGSCRIWLDGNDVAPELHQIQTPYHGSDLRKDADLVQPHFGSIAGMWQNKIASWLEDHTGVEMERSEYMHDRTREEYVKIEEPDPIDKLDDTPDQIPDQTSHRSREVFRLMKFKWKK